MVKAIGTSSFNPFLDVDHAKVGFGGVKRLPPTGSLCARLGKGAPVDVRTVELGPSELTDENHRSADQRTEFI